MAQLKDDVGEIKLLLFLQEENKIIVPKDLEF